MTTIVAKIQRADYEGDRAALNGFNEGANPKELEEDLTQCVRDFREALTRDPAFVDAKVGAGSCLVNHSFLNLKTNRTRAGELFADSVATLNEAFAAARPRSGRTIRRERADARPPLALCPGHSSSADSKSPGEQEGVIGTGYHPPRWPQPVDDDERIAGFYVATREARSVASAGE